MIKIRDRRNLIQTLLCSESERTTASLRSLQPNIPGIRSPFRICRPLKFDSEALPSSKLDIAFSRDWVKFLWENCMYHSIHSFSFAQSFCFETFALLSIRRAEVLWELRYIVNSLVVDGIFLRIFSGALLSLRWGVLEALIRIGPDLFELSLVGAIRVVVGVCLEGLVFGGRESGIIYRCGAILLRVLELAFCGRGGIGLLLRILVFV